MTRQEALAVWAILGAAHSGRPLSADDLTIRAELIRDFPADLAMAAAKVYAQTHNWLPSVSEFRQAVIALPVPDGDDCWAEVIRYVHQYGWTYPPRDGSFSHPAILAAVRGMGDWQDFCATDAMVNRAHFLKLFPAIRDRWQREGLVDPAAAAALDAARAGALRRLVPLEVTDGQG